MRVEILAETESIWAKDGKSKRDNKKKNTPFQVLYASLLISRGGYKKVIR